MLKGLPFVAAKIGPDSGFPQRRRCASSILASGRMTGTAPLLCQVLGPVACPSHIDRVTRVSPSLVVLPPNPTNLAASQSSEGSRREDR